MAKRNSRGQFVRGGSGGRSRGTTSIIKVEAPAAPRRRARSVVVAAPRRRRKSSGGVGSRLLSFGGAHSRTSTLIAAAALGFAQKQGWLAKLPHIGTAGPITSFALLGWGLEELAKMKLPPLVHDMITNALAISAFNLGLSGGTTIVGSELDGGCRPSVSGASYSMPGGAVFFD
jgi:hypothetical protein